MAIHELLRVNREEVLQRWQRLVRGTIAHEAIPIPELRDHLPEFLDQIITALREAPEQQSRPQLPCSGASTVGHGEQRLRLGFSLDAVVYEYGAMRTAIVEAAVAAGEAITFRELQIVFDAVITGIALAVSEYVRQRDSEFRRQSNEHFAFIAHELRNPLGSAKMALALLKARDQVPAGDAAVSALERGIQQASELIDHSLQAARVASGIELRPQWLSLRQLLEDATLDARPEAESKGISLDLSVEPEENVHVDRRLIQSALSNLVRNAVKHTRQGGCVELRGTIDASFMRVEVEDCCGGLPPGLVEHAFAPFVKLGEREDGFGLGLAIVRQAADAHGGNIRIENLPEKGCVFVLEIPVQVDVDTTRASK